MAEQTILKTQLGRLDGFVGHWVNSGVVEAGRFGDGGECTGNTVYHWDERGVWLHYTSKLNMPGLGEYEVSGGVSYNDRANHYIAFAYNNMRSLLTYRGFWDNEQTLIFLSTFPTQDTARIVYRVLESGEITMSSQNRSDNGDYLTYFETTMTAQ